MSSSDETFLESFVESISTLPNEIRRNLGHVKVLDKSYISIVNKLREKEEEYLARAHDIIINIPVHSSFKPAFFSSSSSSQQEQQTEQSNKNNKRRNLMQSDSENTTESKVTKNAKCKEQTNDKEEEKKNVDESVIDEKLPPSSSPTTASSCAVDTSSTKNIDDNANNARSSSSLSLFSSNITIDENTIPTTEERRAKIQDPKKLILDLN